MIRSFTADLTDSAPTRRYCFAFPRDLDFRHSSWDARLSSRTAVDFLQTHPSDYLYLVGDIVDGWHLRRRWYWPQAHNDVVQKILRRARHGTKVFYVPGNHDEAARPFCGCISAEFMSPMRSA